MSQKECVSHVCFTTKKLAKTSRLRAGSPPVLPRDVYHKPQNPVPLLPKPRHGGAIAYEWEEVDNERFVKPYLAGLKQAAGLSKAGLAIFEIAYHHVRDNPGKDIVMLSAAETPLPRATYFRGLRELLDREFLYKSTYDSAYFVNIRFMFNGDRLAFEKGYKLKKEQPTLPGLELEPLPPALPAPGASK